MQSSCIQDTQHIKNTYDCLGHGSNNCVVLPSRFAGVQSCHLIFYTIVVFARKTNKYRLISECRHDIVESVLLSCILELNSKFVDTPKIDELNKWHAYLCSDRIVSISSGIISISSHSRQQQAGNIDRRKAFPDTHRSI